MQNRAIEIFRGVKFSGSDQPAPRQSIASLNHIEEQAVRIIDALDPTNAASAMHCPRLDGDRGQVSQGGVDKMFRGAGRCA
jgi:hypothetical protein